MGYFYTSDTIAPIFAFPKPKNAYPFKLHREARRGRRRKA
ncbi:Hypothetical protein Cp1002B_0188 [Corynebacterium pseudotuberculosis]|nr:Hypothetical protein CpPAT10_0177 [Corynebacterium pseudotuberculosis PAT10]AEP69445.1 Hypothetical protein Cp4202_0172 [Corynebacterium pseudotuberculosis 42/02-A]AFF21339.1 Hypothetical protein CpP54B96_0179 [Corynebacterium pseudotuberculosis P54B96]AFH51093.1 Hypothetical protein Cp267_0185 [Corynebacterium pseudotuberculosis 267]AJC12912.1 Hypothetical protein CpVD57_0179 [Corynebacterium pseudotuberculosis]